MNILKKILRGIGLTLAAIVLGAFWSIADPIICALTVLVTALLVWGGACVVLFFFGGF